jgi:hypothetical protein
VELLKLNGYNTAMLVFHDPNYKPSGNWACSDPSTTRDEFFAAASDSLKWWLP